MNCFQKITLFLLLLLAVIASDAQTERNLMPFTNKVLMNPSYAGLNENTSVWTGLQFFTQPERDIYNEYSLTYDKYMHNWEGGLAFYFNQGIRGDLNINTSEVGIAVSRHFETKSNFFIPSLNINLEYANKQWYVQLIDHLLSREVPATSLPGSHFKRFVRIKPRLGFLWDSEDYQAGIAAQLSLGKNLTEFGYQQDFGNPNVILHLAKKMTGQKKGLVSRPFSTTSEVSFLYSKNIVLSRLSLNVEEVKYFYAVFIQNNFTEDLHGIGGTYGRKIKNIRLNFSGGLSLPYISEEVAYYGEVRLAIIIPSVFYFERNPWAPRKTLYEKP